MVEEKMDGSSFYTYHSEFYLVQVNTHTDFGDLMQQLDHRTREGMRDLFINRKWHHCTTGSAKALVWCLGSQYHNNASGARLVIWYLLSGRAIWRKMANERLQSMCCQILKSGAYPLSIPLLPQIELSVLLKPTFPNSLSWHLLKVCPISVIAIGVSNIIVFIVIYRDQTTNVFCYQYKRCSYERAKFCRFTEMHLALYF